MSTEALIALGQETALRLIESDARRLFYHMYPDETTVWQAASNRHFHKGAIIYARELYKKHLEFFRAGATYRERCFMAANRVSKTLGGGGYELSCHLTGLYPDWWEGRRFEHAIYAWAAGKTNETTRDIIQPTLLGGTKFAGTPNKTVDGTGVIPGDLLQKPTWKQGVQDLVDVIKVKHVSGEFSTLGFKAYNQGRGSFEGVAQHVIWMDEEPPFPVWDECLIRTATTNGLIMLTFTPLEGMSEVVLKFMPQEFKPDL